MITTNDADVAARAKLIRNHGMPVRYTHTMLGFNLRMTDIHAAIGLNQLKKLPARNQQRRANARQLNERLAGCGVGLPVELPGCEHVWHQYTIRVPQGRDAAVDALTKAGIGTGVYYPKPIHQQPMYLELGYKDDLPVTQKAAAEVISLPVRPDLTAEELTRVVDAVRALKVGA